jgi:hypothetical protein
MTTPIPFGLQVIFVFIVSLVLSAPNAQAEPGGIILYKTSDWTGASLLVHEKAITNLNEYDWNDSVKSFTVTAGNWVIYRDDNFSGEHPYDVEGPFGPGNHTLGDNTDSLSGNITSLRRLPDQGVTLFEHSYLRGTSRNFTTSNPNIRGNYIDIPLLEQRIYPDDFSNVASSAWIPESEFGQWTFYDGFVYSGYNSYIRPLQYGVINQFESNDSISSLYRLPEFDNRGSEVEGPVTDSSLIRPKNNIALDSGTLSGEKITTGMQVRLNGFQGTFHDTCAGYDFFHVQHMVRLPNKNGRAYFMASQSNSSDDMDRAEGYITVFRMDEDAYDPVTDLMIDTPGTDGEYIWSQYYNSASPIGDWNHPGKMAVLGNVLVLAAEQWGSKFCDARPAVDDDAVVFYDVRDPENPKYWGKLSARELQVDVQEAERYSQRTINRRVINTVSLDKIGNDIILTVGGNKGKKVHKARNGVVTPNLQGWDLIGTGDVGFAHGMTYTSKEENLPYWSPGQERLISFDGKEVETLKPPCYPYCKIPKKMVFREIQWFVNGGGGKSYTIPSGFDVGLDNSSRQLYAWWPTAADYHKSEDAATAYVTNNRRVAFYAPEARDASNASSADFANDAALIADPSIATNNLQGYKNRYWQMHSTESSLTVENPDNGDLRFTVGSALSGSVIDFAPELDGQTIQLSLAYGDEIEIFKNLIIDASSLPNGITISAANNHRIFNITPTGSLTLINVTLTGGNSTQNSGAILNYGRLELIRSKIIGNTATSDGGGIGNVGSVYIYDSTIADNTAGNSGGGIFNFVPSSKLYLRNVTMYGNSAQDGGALASAAGSIEAQNCTIANNSASVGSSGINGSGTTTEDQAIILDHCTVLDDIDVTAQQPGKFLMNNTVAANVTGDFHGTAANLVQSHTGSNNGTGNLIIAADLKMNALADNGGDTLTSLPMSDSPAIDNGSIDLQSDTDQRRASRSLVPDIGALETPDLNLSILGISGTALSPALDTGVLSYTVTTSYRNPAVLQAESSQIGNIIEFSLNGSGYEPLLTEAGEYALLRPVNLDVGLNTINVKVSSISSDFEKIYTLAVTREPASSNVDLQWLASSNMELDSNFDSSMLSYDAGTTPAKQLRVWAEARDMRSSVQLRINAGAYVTIPSNARISAGSLHSLSINTEDHVLGWGSAKKLGTSDHVFQNQPANNIGAQTEVSAGGSHSLALGVAGRIEAWGDNSFGQTDEPGLDGILAVAAGVDHSLALRSAGGGTVLAWGSNSHGQSTVPPGLTDVVRISAGNAHSLALKSDGTVVAWGDNSSNQLDVPIGLTDVVAISAGYDFSLALKSDGTVVRWGDSLSNGLTNVPSNLQGVVAVAAGMDSTLSVNLALKGDGSIIPWGALADCEIETVSTKATAISAGGKHRLALGENGKIFGWGSNSSTQLNAPLGLNIPVPTSPLLDLVAGINTIEILVTAENGATRTYTLTITQDENAPDKTIALAPNNLDSIFEGSKRYFRNITLIGTTIDYRITGALGNSLWGTDIYTLDSNLANAVVHTGVLAPGEEGVVTVTIVEEPDQFVGSSRNGVLSKNFAGSFAPTAFKVRRSTGDSFAQIREEYEVEPGYTPTSLKCYGSRVGETVNFLVVGSTPADADNPLSQQVIWHQASAERYTQDSPLGVAAVHAGILTHGERGLVAVTISEGFSFISGEESADTQLQNGVRPNKRGDNHSSFVEGSYTLAGIVSYAANDSDGDGLSDAEEEALNTNPYLADSDGDGLPDGWEAANNTDPNTPDANADPDSDLLSNAQELEIGTDPQDSDTDNDLMPDGWEYAFGLNPKVADGGADPDGDTFTNLEEYQNGTDPLVWESNALIFQDEIFGAGFESIN